MLIKNLAILVKMVRTLGKKSQELFAGSVPSVPVRSPESSKVDSSVQTSAEMEQSKASSVVTEEAPSRRSSRSRKPPLRL